MTFEELKQEAMKASGRDRLGSTAVALIAEICNTKAEINEARTSIMMAHQVAQHNDKILRRGMMFLLALNLGALAWLASIAVLMVQS